MNIVITLGSENGILQATLFKSVFGFLSEQDKSLNPAFISAVNRYLSNSGYVILLFFLFIVGMLSLLTEFQLK